MTYLYTGPFEDVAALACVGRRASHALPFCSVSSIDTALERAIACQYSSVRISGLLGDLTCDARSSEHTASSKVPTSCGVFGFVSFLLISNCCDTQWSVPRVLVLVCRNFGLRSPGHLYRLMPSPGAALVVAFIRPGPPARPMALRSRSKIEVVSQTGRDGLTFSFFSSNRRETRAATFVVSPRAGGSVYPSTWPRRAGSRLSQTVTKREAALSRDVAHAIDNPGLTFLRT